MQHLLILVSFLNAVHVYFDYEAPGLDIPNQKKMYPGGKSEILRLDEDLGSFELYFLYISIKCLATCCIINKLNGIDVLDGNLQSFVQHVIEGTDVMFSEGFKG